MTPLIPADVDLRGLPFMPLDTVRLLDSDLFALSTGEEFKAAVALWCKSWTQVPAASIPNDERILAHLSGAGPRWKRVRDMALRGWTLCDDGRFYHPVIAEKAFDAWEHRVDFQETVGNKTERQRRWRERLKELSGQLRDVGITPPRGASLETLEALLRDATVDGKASTYASTSASTVDGVETGKRGTGTGTGTEQRANPPDGGSSTAPADRPPLALVPSPLGSPPAPPPVPDCPHAQIVDAFHRLLPELPRVQEWTVRRREHLSARWKAKPKRRSLAWWEKLFGYIGESPFLLGQSAGRDGGRPFVMTLDWLVKSEENLVKVIEGNYHEAQG